MEMTIQKILDFTTIAVVGMSPKPIRASHSVAKYMANQGYKIVPVNPGQDEIAGLKCYHSLEEIPFSIDVVDVFRRSEACLRIAESAINIGAKALWLQEGIINDEAASIAEDAGLLFIQNKCILKEHRRLMT